MAVAELDMGRLLDSAVIQKGLRELNKDIVFDVVVKRPDEWGNVLQFPNADALESARKNRMPVMYRDSYICGLDRGMVPEFKQWTVKEVLTDIPWHDADRWDASVRWQTIPFDAPDYIDLHLAASRGSDPSLMLMPGGLVARCVARGYVKVKNRVAVLGWRHTFERIIQRDIPGAWRNDIAMKFGVDMLKFPCGDPQDVRAALIEE